MTAYHVFPMKYEIKLQMLLFMQLQLYQMPSTPKLNLRPLQWISKR